nr:hypothetical protein Q903MT_gene2050 [Picea sitchensis]
MVLQSFSSAPPPTMAFNPDREKGSVDRAEYEWWECLLFEVPKGTRGPKVNWDEVPYTVDPITRKRKYFPPHKK